ncbi:TetR/AcrR family transcriptional regulator (plasmid) [Coraliomargarita sp. W4R53]
MSTRAALIEATAELLASSPDGDFSTRAVCEAAGVQQPALYRIFGDKDGLLAATIDTVWEQYLGMKRAAKESDDPLDDLRSGWNSHTQFALEHSNAYKLLFGASALDKAESANEAMRLLRVVLERLAVEGRLLVEPAEAARIIMAANTGVALALVLRPSLYPDLALSASVRDIVHASLISSDSAVIDAAHAARVAAITLASRLPDMSEFTAAESGLLSEWLSRVASSPSTNL